METGLIVGVRCRKFSVLENEV